MKTAAILLIYSSCAYGLVGGPFRDLGFDDANTNKLVNTGGPVGLGSGTTGDLLPGWQLALGAGPYSDSLWVNLAAIDLGLASLYNRDNIGFGAQGHFPASGIYSFAMVPSYGMNGGGPYTPFSLSQTGDVPANAQMLHFTIYGSPFEVRVNNTLLPVIYTQGPPTTNPNTRTSWAVADISAFAGQTVTLKFTSLDTDGLNTVVNGLDSISFAPVPEPGTTLLLFAGLLSLTAASLRRGRSGRSSRRH
jgi:hypothetical protein